MVASKRVNDRPTRGGRRYLESLVGIGEEVNRWINQALEGKDPGPAPGRSKSTDPAPQSVTDQSWIDACIAGWMDGRLKPGEFPALIPSRLRTPALRELGRLSDEIDRLVAQMSPGMLRLFVRVMARGRR